jgi:hypothetical protein
LSIINKGKIVSAWYLGDSGGEGRGKRGAREKGGEMTQTWYAHMNKRNKKSFCLFIIIDYL